MNQHLNIIKGTKVAGKAESVQWQDGDFARHDDTFVTTAHLSLVLPTISGTSPSKSQTIKNALGSIAEGVFEFVSY
jgi:hypothetical protein